jgi:hypothetical protein
MVSKATCAGRICEDLSLRRGLGPHHVRRKHVGTWETSLRPQPSLDGSGSCREAEEAKPSGKVRGVGRGSSTGEALEQGWDDQRRRAWREGPRPEGEGVDRNRLRTLRRTPSDQCGPRSRSGLMALSRTSVTLYFREDPGAGKPHARICAGGREVIPVPTATHCKQETWKLKRSGDRREDRVSATLRAAPRIAPSRHGPPAMTAGALSAVGTFAPESASRSPAFDPKPVGPRGSNLSLQVVGCANVADSVLNQRTQHKLCLLRSCVRCCR